jgi:hypothetical protein
MRIAWIDDLAEDVVLEASVLAERRRGRDEVLAVMKAAGSYYARFEFVHQNVAGARTYLEWEATGPTGTEMAGVTVLTRNDDNQVVHVAIHHRPLGAVLELSRTL